MFLIAISTNTQIITWSMVQQRAHLLIAIAIITWIWFSQNLRFCITIRIITWNMAQQRFHLRIAIAIMTCTWFSQILCYFITIKIITLSMLNHLSHAPEIEGATIMLHEFVFITLVSFWPKAHAGPGQRIRDAITCQHKVCHLPSVAGAGARPRQGYLGKSLCPLPPTANPLASPTSPPTLKKT